MSEQEIQEQRKELDPVWRVEEGKKLSRTFLFKNFRELMIFINAVADLAEQEQHHPDIHAFYNKVVIELWTHAVGGLSENDFIMAAKIDGLEYKAE